MNLIRTDISLIKRTQILMMLLFILFFSCGCKKSIEEATTITLESLENEEDKEKIVEIAQDELDVVLKKLQRDMLVFDVIEYHDKLHDLVKSNVVGGETDEELNKLITPIVEEFIEEILDEKIKGYLGENISSNYISWLKARVSTKELLRLMVAYEREYIKSR